MDFHRRAYGNLRKSSEVFLSRSLGRRGDENSSHAGRYQQASAIARQLQRIGRWRLGVASLEISHPSSQRRPRSLAQRRSRSELSPNLSPGLKLASTFDRLAKNPSATRHIHLLQGYHQGCGRQI